VCTEIIDKFSGTNIAIANIFFQQYFLNILQDVYFVLTDSNHKGGFKLQSQLLARMYQLVEMDQIHALLFVSPEMADPNLTNAMLLREYTANLLKAAFPHVQM
jgi:exportin-1